MIDWEKYRDGIAASIHDVLEFLRYEEVDGIDSQRTKECLRELLRAISKERKPPQSEE